MCAKNSVPEVTINISILNYAKSRQREIGRLAGSKKHKHTLESSGIFRASFFSSTSMASCAIFLDVGQSRLAPVILSVNLHLLANCSLLTRNSSCSAPIFFPFFSICCFNWFSELWCLWNLRICSFPSKLASVWNAKMRDAPSPSPDSEDFTLDRLFPLLECCDCHHVYTYQVHHHRSDALMTKK